MTGALWSVQMEQMRAVLIPAADIKSKAPVRIHVPRECEEAHTACVDRQQSETRQTFAWCDYKQDSQRVVVAAQHRCFSRP